MHTQCQYNNPNLPHSLPGMKRSGSDELSDITANPTVGMFSDLPISKGGTTILTEMPEMFGLIVSHPTRLPWNDDCQDAETGYSQECIPPAVSVTLSSRAPSDTGSSRMGITTRPQSPSHFLSPQTTDPTR